MGNSQSRSTRRTSHIATTATVAAALAVAIAIISTATIDAHKGITSKYTYNDDVYPILRDKCGRCHAESGPAPMSLLRYSIDAGGAAAWAESIRENLVSETMPTLYAAPTVHYEKINRILKARSLVTI